METILVVDDEKNYLLVLEDLLAEEGYQVITAESANKALELFGENELDVVLTDMRMPGMDGMELMDRLHDLDKDLPVIMMTAYGTVEKAVEAMKKAAYDYVTKPFKNEDLIKAVRKAADHRRLLCKNRQLTEELQGRYQFGNIIGKSAGMQRVFRLIEKVAPTKATVLITGASGTGKELIARAIHYNSDRKDQAFISVNCGAIPETLLESELFGHEKGAFSGAVSQRKGRFELSDRGTLFLDEISEMSQSLQVKLLRVLQEMEFERVGGVNTIRVDVRVLAASNRNLKEEAAEGNFRSDLFYRLNVVNIELPPLKDRKDDIPLLINHFLCKYKSEDGVRGREIARETLALLMAYPWPGNVRELENAIERAMILCSGEKIQPVDLPSEIREYDPEREAARADKRPVGTDGGLRSGGDAWMASPPAIDAGDDAAALRPRQFKAADFVKQFGYITNKRYSELSGISERQALRELSELVDAGVLRRVGKGRGVRYVAAQG